MTPAGGPPAGVKIIERRMSIYYQDTWGTGGRESELRSANCFKKMMVIGPTKQIRVSCDKNFSLGRFDSYQIVAPISTEANVDSMSSVI